MKQLELCACSKRFESGWALRDASISLERGQTVGIVGPSGSGKSTVVRLLSGLERPTAGTVSWDRHDLRQLSAKAIRTRRRHVQLIFQDSASALSPRRTIAQSLLEPLLTYAIGSASERLHCVHQWLDRVNLGSDYLNRFPHQLSGGERQRVALARSLMLEPDFLLADEPVSALDVISKVETLSLLQQFQTELGFCLVMVSHDPRVIDWLCDEVATIHDGMLATLERRKQRAAVINEPVL